MSPKIPPYPDHPPYFYTGELGEEVHRLMSLAYHIVLAIEEDGTWDLRMLELPGCVSKGKTFMEALHGLREIQEGWFISHLRSRQRVPLPLEDIWQRA